MRIAVMSDLHFEFHRDGGVSFLDTLSNDSADVLLLAGDLSICSQLEDAVKSICNRYKQVVYVAGNHEYYQSYRTAVEPILSRLTADIPNFHWLENDTVTLTDEGGHEQRFVGCTLWFPDAPDNVLYEAGLNDFHVIGGFKPWVYQRNQESMDFLSNTIQTEDIVITHHAPSSQSVGTRFQGSDFNRFFVCKGGDQILAATKPKLWVHGHMHSGVDYMAGDTRVLCNPFGYPHEGNNFDEKLFLELP